MAIASEQGRVYRATINGLLSTGDGARLTYQLRELRCTREAIDAAQAAENAAAAAQAQANAEAAPVHINVISVPAGHFMQADGSFAPLAPEALLQLEHMPEPEPQPQLDEAPLPEPAPIESWRERDDPDGGVILFGRRRR